MRNSTNLRNGDGFRYPHQSDSRRAERSINQRLETGEAISDFLKNAVIGRLTRERATGPSTDEANRDDSFTTRGEGQSVNLRVLPLPGAALDRNFPADLPTWKRLLDGVIISLTWPVWLPLMILIMFAIKITSAGPVFYRQERVGYRGNRFMIFKFRTMKVNVDTSVHESHFERLVATDSPMTKLDAHGDPRLIKWGRFLRATGLDELPQIFNILRGEMSLVGARPCTVPELERYQSWQRERINCPPGLTGYWQVNGKNKTTFSEMIEMDIFYGKNMCVTLDLSIMLRTIPAIVLQVLDARVGTMRWKRDNTANLPHLS